MDYEQFIKVLELRASSIILGWLLIVLGLIIKDLLTSAAFGLMFYLDPSFKEGDKVWFDGEKAVIQKIGLAVSVFKMLETGRWRYVKNEKIRYHKLEKEVEK